CRQTIVCADSGRSKEPEQFFYGLPRDVRAVTALQHGCPDGQCVAEIVCCALAKDDQPSAVIITDQWRCAIRTSDMQQVVKQAAELRANDISQPRVTRLRQQQRVEIEVGGVAVIVRRLLEMHTIAK